MGRECSILQKGELQEGVGSHLKRIGDSWTSITPEEFNEYRINPALISGTRSSTTTATLPTRTRDPIAEFKKGIKRDSNSFSVYKDEKQWDTWQQSTLAQARAQDVAEILDGNYVATSAEDTALFWEKQKFMYAVFERTLQTDQGKAFVRGHETDFDAQAIYRGLVEYSLKSTKASLDTSTTLAYITSAKVGDGSWKGTSQAFILHWQDQIRLYEKLVAKTEHFPDSIKRVMLENAVRPIAELRAVKDQADQLKTTSGKDLTYEEYSRLTLSAAANYDVGFLPQGRYGQATPRRAVYRHELVMPEDAIIEDVNGQYDIDIGIDTIQANVTNQHAPGSRMPFPRWKSLSPETQGIWDTIPDHEKATILGGPNGYSAMAPRGGTRPSRAQNSHSIRDAPHIAAYLHELGLQDAPPPDTNGNDTLPGGNELPALADDSSNSTTLLAHATKRTWSKLNGSVLPPSDIRKVLSSVKRHDPSSQQEETQEITIQGKTYRLVNVACTYNVSAARHCSKHASLVDRGANGGIAGEDVRIIFKTMRSSVDIQGIDNHQVTNIPIVTSTGGVVQSQRGDVIAILHQY